VKSRVEVADGAFVPVELDERQCVDETISVAGC
jgi:hypothetical protein